MTFNFWPFARRPADGAYRLHDGRYVDALNAQRKLLVGGVGALLAACESPDDAEWDDAVTRLCALVRSAFGVPPFDPATGWGYDDQRCLDALFPFLEFAAKKWRRGER